MEKETTKVKPSKRTLLSMILKRVLPIFLLVLISVGAAVFLVKKKPEVLGLTSQNTETKELEKVVEAVGKLMSLPSDESPAVATVSDIEKLKDQQFFKNAQNGDKVLIYASGKRAILYRPSENKIIDVGVINASKQPQTSSTPSASLKPSNTWNVALYNGTEVVGASRAFETSLKSAVKEVVISERAIAFRTDYTESLVVDLKGGRSEDAKKLAQVLGIAVGVLPQGEKAPTTADFLVIVGSDNVPAQ